MSLSLSSQYKRTFTSSQLQLINISLKELNIISDTLELEAKKDCREYLKGLKMSLQKLKYKTSSKKRTSRITALPLLAVACLISIVAKVYFTAMETVAKSQH